MSSRSKLKSNPKSLKNSIDDIDTAIYSLRLIILIIIFGDIVMPTIWALYDYKGFVEEYGGVVYLISVYSISFYYIFSSVKSKIIAFVFRHLKRKMFLRKWAINMSFHMSSLFIFNNNTQIRNVNKRKRKPKSLSLQHKKIRARTFKSKHSLTIKPKTISLIKSFPPTSLT